MVACTDGPQAMNACGWSIYYFKANYAVANGCMHAHRQRMPVARVYIT